MEFITKYKVGDNVFTIDQTSFKIRELLVDSIQVTFDREKTAVKLYAKNDYFGIDEDKCFVSKEALLKHITGEEKAEA